ncbi:hypothetical protein Moror_132 [Moniliophthora roreri MCA 2997]|uniref:DUF6534 domain-containing protein n=1 Tax=Moniliophthora roreri (strain MCA 2997) TaxID=1381753 RepID=V2XX88_MONRO|nr:hypothetical protein Moror_132 [Moniliophthora roreri MCA 2997]
MSNANVPLTPVTSLPNGIDLSAQEDPVYYGFVVSTLYEDEPLHRRLPNLSKTVRLTGITIVQAWIYINTNTDRWALRMLVASLILLDMATLVLNVVFIHHDYIANFGNLSAISEIPPSAMSLLPTALVDCCVQDDSSGDPSYYYHCLHNAAVLRESDIHTVHRTVPFFVAVSSAGALISGLAGIANAFRHPVEQAIDSVEFKIEIGTSSALSLLCDLVATIALLWSFRAFRTGFRRTDTALQTLIEYTITRGVLVTVVQVCIIISYVIRPDRFFWLAFHMAEGKIYVITMIAMLNSRTALRRAQVSVVSVDTTAHNPPTAAHPVFAQATVTNTDSFELKTLPPHQSVRETDLQRVDSEPGV